MNRATLARVLGVSSPVVSGLIVSRLGRLPGSGGEGAACQLIQVGVILVVLVAVRRPA